MNLVLSESYVTTILSALVHEDTGAAWGTIAELERQGVRIPPWVSAIYIMRFPQPAMIESEPALTL